MELCHGSLVEFLEEIKAVTLHLSPTFIGYFATKQKKGITNERLWSTRKTAELYI